MAILRMISEKILIWLPEWTLQNTQIKQQNNHFWFPTHETPAKTEDHTPPQTRIPRELLELKEEKLNQKTIHKPELNSSNGLIGLIACWWKLRIHQLKVFRLSFMTVLKDTERTMGETQISRWSLYRKSIKLFTVKVHQCQFTWNKT